jgi:hypothetical protein
MGRDYLEHALHDAGRIELRHQTGDRWVSGLFDDIGALRAEINRRADRGNLFTTINAPRLMSVSNTMSDRALVDADIAFHTRVVFDFDPIRPKNTPSTEGEMHSAGRARDRMVAALLSVGWSRPAIAFSGNGAHALYRWRMPVSVESTAMLATLYRGMKNDFGVSDVDFDITVRNPARIWRLYGTRNRKGTPTPDRPHRMARISIPARWEAVSPSQVERLSSMYARRPMPQTPARGSAVVSGEGDYSTLDAAAWFAAHGHYRRRIGPDMHAVRCLWEREHSTIDGAGSTATVIWDANGRCWPNFRCQHAHCDGRGIRDVLAAWADADAFCARAWRAPP